MMSKLFFDTNVLLYSCDFKHPRKQNIAQTVIEHAGDGQFGCLSTQVMQKFYSAAVKRLQIDPLKAKNILMTFSRWETAAIISEDVYKAMDLSVLSKLSFWDALIVVAAAKLKCALLYTEDLNHGQIISGVQIVNPFHETV